MQYEEKGRIEQAEGYGIIKLQNVANPETVIVSLLGVIIYPEAFTIFGEPIFSKEMVERFNWIERNLKRKMGFDYELTALVHYDKLEIDLNEIDTLKGISNNVKDLNSFRQLIINRRRVEYNKNPYIVFGKYFLDKFGMIWILGENEKVFETSDVQTYDDFKKFYKKRVLNFIKAIIPNPKNPCPWCTRKFTIKDLKNRNERFGLINGKVAHTECLKRYEIEKDKDKIIYEIMEKIYPGVTFDEIPNGSGVEKDSIIPWYICHTPDGDIKIGTRGTGQISIEWLKNFKHFNMKIFDKSVDIKWEKGIIAPNKDIAISYIKKVKESIHKK